LPQVRPLDPDHFPMRDYRLHFPIHARLRAPTRCQPQVSQFLWRDLASFQEIPSRRWLFFFFFLRFVFCWFLGFRLPPFFSARCERVSLSSRSVELSTWTFCRPDGFRLLTPPFPFPPHLAKRHILTSPPHHQIFFGF